MSLARRSFRLPRLSRRAWTGVLAGLAAAFLLGNRGMRAMAASWWNLRGLRADLASARREELQLQDRIAAAKGDDRALERAARSELGFQRPGEIEYRFPKPVRKAR
ncbi:septum formation initiator family protein [bacterium]|nr:MAG: septum formation initiator family protein [bacterium]